MPAVPSLRGRFERRLAVLMASLVMLGGLAACASEDTDPRACPRVAILGDAATMTRFAKPDSVDLTDIAVKAALSDIQGGCEYYDDEVDVSFDVTLSAERGPALTGNTANIDYFVSILDPDGKVLTKKNFNTPVTFPDGVFRAGTRESLEQTIPIAQNSDARGYTVLLGLQLTRAEVAYNRERQKR